MKFDRLFFIRCLLHVWPRYINERKRTYFKKFARPFVTVQDRKNARPEDLNYVDPWAVIRVKNEAITLRACLNSIVPLIHKGIIVYNECTDGSEEIIREFCDKHPGFIALEYPHKILMQTPAGIDPNTVAEENTLAGQANFVLKHIPQGEWFIKIDADQVYFQDILRHSFSLPKKKSDWVIYSRLDCHYDKERNLKFIQYIRPGDHWLICNQGLRFINTHRPLGDGRTLFFEKMKFDRSAPRDFCYAPECSSLHFPALKKYRTYCFGEEHFKPFSVFPPIAPKDEISEEILNLEAIHQLTKDFQLH